MKTFSIVPTVKENYSTYFRKTYHVTLENPREHQKKKSQDDDEEKRENLSKGKIERCKFDMKIGGMIIIEQALFSRDEILKDLLDFSPSFLPTQNERKMIQWFKNKISLFPAPMKHDDRDRFQTLSSVHVE